MQEHYGSVNLKPTEGSNCGIWMSTVCINARTTELHSEDDCTYTIIKVPKQNRNMNSGNSNKDHQRMFLLSINDGMLLSIPLCHNLSFIFCGKYLTHRQHQSHSVYEDNSLFYNISSYGNKRLYSHLKKSFLRNHNI